MADPVKTFRSLETLSSEYSVFERDQVLTEAQLNSVASYFDDQARLTRVALLGVGIVGGLRPSTVSGKIKVSKGLGLTTDGDLLLLPIDTSYDSIKPYDDKAPVYQPFYSGSPQTMFKMWELVKEGESDVSKQPLSSLPSALTNYAVVMYMESYELDHDLCTAADCDNLGIVAMHTPRMLLILKTDADKLLATIPTLTDKASLLPELVADRPSITGALTTTSALFTLYLNACGNIHTSLVNAVDELHKQIPVLTQDLFGSDPSPAWIATLNTIHSGFTAAGSGIQYYYAFLRDLVETWNALRECLLDNDGSMCPDLFSFPKHLLLGAVSDPAQLRTSFFPSPLIGNGRSHLEHAHFLTWKLHVLINTFALPATSPAPAIIVTPGRSELQCLEERAIPYYYRANSSFNLLTAWNWLRTRRGTHTGITAYRAAALGASAAAQTPLAGQIGRYDFFRIEGHLGQDIDTVMDKLESDIATKNLPFSVRAVLLHSSTAPIKRKPKIRYNDMHRLHKLVRADLDSELQRTASFSTEYTKRIKTAASNKEIPNDTAKLNKADKNNDDIIGAVTETRKAFGNKTYSGFRADNQWTAQYDKAVTTAGTYKRDFGDVSRMDYVTAFDSAIVSKQKSWIDWIDILIDDKDKKADERLLFSTYLKTHPGVEHAGGVLRGGTFVVVYNDSAKVVADFMLPYREAEVVEDEPEEPLLTYVPPVFVNDGYVIVKPIEWRFDDLKVGIRDEWMKEITIQKDYTTFFKDSLGTLGDVWSKFAVNSNLTVGGELRPDTGDAYLNSLLDEIASKTKQMDQMRNQLAKGDTPRDVAEQLGMQLDRYQKDLGNVVKEATGRMVKTNVDISSGKAGAGAVQIVGKGLLQVTDQAQLKGIATEFQGLQTGASSVQVGIVSGVMNVGGMKIG